MFPYFINKLKRSENSGCLLATSVATKLKHILSQICQYVLTVWEITIIVERLFICSFLLLTNNILCIVQLCGYISLIRTMFEVQDDLMEIIFVCTALGLALQHLLSF